MKKILIVEDDLKVAKVLELRMKSAGYQTIHAADAIQAVVTATSSQPDLVLLDINLPGGNGIEVAKRLRNVMPDPLPIVFLTASKKPGLVEQAMELGPNVGFLEKPYYPATLLAATRRGLQEN